MSPPAIERMGYYPTDDPAVEIIKTYLKPPVESERLFDPCAGEGKVAASQGKAIKLHCGAASPVAARWQ